jgi:hypothetical protein
MRVFGRLSQRPSIEHQIGLFTSLEEAEIRIGARYLLGEFLGDLRLRPGKSSFSGAKSHEGKLVVFAGLHLEGTSVGAVRNDGVANVG